MNDTPAILLLSKNGDQINFLPVAKHIFDTTGVKPHWIVASGYHSTLGGVSYVEVVQTGFNATDAPKAIVWAKERYSDVRMAQTWGRHWHQSGNGVSFNVESWLNCGMTVEQFNDTKNFPVIFDNRSLERENFVTQRAVQTDKPLILMSVGCSKSSPFASHHVFIEAIKRKWENFEIVSLCNVKCGALYDMLSLFERAKLLITTDGSALHLAAAVQSLPVIALVNDDPWKATTPRCNVALKLTYSEWHTRMTEIHATIRRHL